MVSSDLYWWPRFECTSSRDAILTQSLIISARFRLFRQNFTHSCSSLLPFTLTFLASSEHEACKHWMAWSRQDGWAEIHGSNCQLLYSLLILCSNQESWKSPRWNYVGTMKDECHVLWRSKMLEEKWEREKLFELNVLKIDTSFIPRVSSLLLWHWQPIVKKFGLLGSAARSGN